MLVLKIKQNKLDKKVDVGILVSYSNNTIGYKLMVCKDVMIHEFFVWDWIK